MYCPNCGTKNEDDSLFCYQCGTSLAAPAQPSTPTPAQPVLPPQRQNLMALAAAAVAIIAIAALVFVVFRQPSPTVIVAVTPGPAFTQAPYPTYTPYPTPTSARLLITQKEVEVQANVKWQDSGITVKSGDTVTIRYVAGQWSIWLGVDPLTDGDGQKGRPEKTQIMPEANLGSLIGRIGTNPPFFIGNGTTIRSNYTGNLMLSMNDDVFRDNGGSLTVSVVVER